MTYFQWIFFTDIMNLITFFYFTGFILQIITDFVSDTNKQDVVWVKILRALLWPIIIKRFQK